MLIAVSGLIGAGKSTLVSHLDGAKFYEPIDDNPYLTDYYKDPVRWCFPMQVHLLHARYRMIKHAYYTQLNDGGDAILDRSIYEDYSFAALGHESGYMSDQEFATYCTAHEDYCSTGIPFPDLILHLDAPVTTLLEHIQKRDRSCEANLMADYLVKLRAQYEQLLVQLEKKVPVYYIDATQSADKVLADAQHIIAQRRKELETAVPRYRGGC